jgi:hypothetical protein
MKKRRRRLGSPKSASPLEQAANAAGSWCEQEFATGRHDPAEDACKMGVNRVIRIIRRMKR